MAKTNFKNIDEYNLCFNGEVFNRLIKIRNIIKEVSKESEEVISYQIPAFKLQGKFLVYYCAFTKHISISSPWTKNFLNRFKKELVDFNVSKSVIQFQLKDEFPVSLIKEIVLFRKNEIEND